jgi:hypothetical protein
MTTTVHLLCPGCGAEVECEVTLNEECDLPEYCEVCGRALSDLCDEAQAEALQKLIERSERMHE